MAEIFNVDLPPRFQYKPGTEEEVKRDVEEYLDRFSSAIDEMFKRVFNRLDGNIETIIEGLWEVDGTETQLITADELDMQSKKIINLTDPSAAQHAATKASQDAGDLWEITGGVTRLKTGDEIDARTQKISNVVDPTTDQGVMTKKLHDDDFDTSTGHVHDGSDSKKVEADDLEDGGIGEGEFLVVESGVVVGVSAPSGLSNVIYQWTGHDTADTDIQHFQGFTLTPAMGGADTFDFWAGDSDTAKTFRRFKYKHLSGVSTITIHGRIWSSSSDAAREAELTVDIGGQNNFVKRQATTPAWATPSDVDVSGLTPGTLYDGVCQLSNETDADRAYCSAITLIAS